VAGIEAIKEFISKLSGPGKADLSSLACCPGIYFFMEAQMNFIYRNPNTEDGIHNIILQNRCGNKMTALFYKEHAELEIVYKPNAYRRKEYFARNFSNRDIYTVLFKELRIIDIKPEYIRSFDYDPFVTKVFLESHTGARNTLTFINVVDENCFAISATSPLTIAFKPRKEFITEDGLLYEKFIDRGEEIVSFVLFGSYLENRFRLLDNGTYVLQITENDMIYFGGEENIYQVRRLAGKLKAYTLDELISYSEKQIKAYMDRSRLNIEDAEFQKVVDLNKRIVFSMTDEGGVTFGAINRLYHLIWIRDTMMSSSMLALSGNPYLLERTYPFILNSPSTIKRLYGFEYRQYLQLAGTKWCKNENDGLFYLVYGLYNLYQTTGNDTYLYSEELTKVTDAVDYSIKTQYDTGERMFGSDTIGETALRSSPFFGYDAVNGQMDEYRDPQGKYRGRNVAYCYSIYHNINMYNVLRMLEVLINASPDMDSYMAEKYGRLASTLKESIKSRFINKDGIYRVAYLVLDNGERVWQEELHNPWEYSWAVSLGPFYPDIVTALKSARAVYGQWGPGETYGFCPWNTISRILKEYGMTDDEYKSMLSSEIRDALTYTEKYPMTGASTEYAGSPWTLRALPFSTGSLVYSLQSLILQPLAMGIAVRASKFVNKAENFIYRKARIYAETIGKGEVVTQVIVNGRELKGTLQIPESYLRSGKNHIQITGGVSFDRPRLYSSSVVLNDIMIEESKTEYVFDCVSEADLVFENLQDRNRLNIYDSEGKSIEYTLCEVPGTNKTVAGFTASGMIKAVLS